MFAMIQTVEHIEYLNEAISLHYSRPNSQIHGRILKYMILRGKAPTDEEVKINKFHLKFTEEENTSWSTFNSQKLRANKLIRIRDGVFFKFKWIMFRQNQNHFGMQYRETSHYFLPAIRWIKVDWNK